MQQRTFRRTLSRRQAWSLTGVVGAAILCGSPASLLAQATCTDGACPSEFIELESPQIQTTKTSFKFQARISQAKLPVDDVEFPTVIVKLREGSTTWCSQTLDRVKVRDSVLNIEVGPDTGMTCSMPIEEVIASKSGLGFQICINNEENCLKPIALSSVPYSVKAEFARRAQQAYQADIAAQSHYAHRMAADLDLLTNPTIGRGYYDFHSPLVSTVVNGPNTPVGNQEGVIQWTPVANGERKLNICVKGESDGAQASTLEQLDELKLHAMVTRGYGELEVTGATRLLSTLDVTGASVLNNTLDVAQATRLASTLDVQGNSTLLGTLGVADATTLQSTLQVAGPAQLNDALTVAGPAAFAGVLSVEGSTTIQDTLHVHGNAMSFFEGPVTFNGPVNIPLPVGAITSDTLTVTGTATLGALAVGSSAVLGELSVVGLANAGELSVNGAASVAGPLTSGDLSVDGAALVTGSLTAGALTISGLTRFNGQVTMGTQQNVVFGTENQLPPSSVWYSTIAGGSNNIVIADSGYGTIGGGYNNRAGHLSTVGGGTNNRADIDYSADGGGFANVADASYATVAGGGWNTATGDAFSFVGGGSENTASGLGATVAGGNSNVASGNYATVPGGADNVAAGTYSFAAGRNAKANASGCFVWAGSSASDIVCNNSNRWIARTSGGVFFYTNTALSAGVSVAAGGGSWSSVSDRNQKHEIHEVDPARVLAALEQVPIATWRYRTEESQALHMGPMAQDFYAAFNLGDSDKHITTVDADGVALAAVKGVHAITKRHAEKIEAQSATIESLNRELNALRAQNASLEERLERLESRAEPRTPWHGAGMYGGAASSFAALGLAFALGRRRRETA